MLQKGLFAIATKANDIIVKHQQKTPAFEKPPILRNMRPKIHTHARVPATEQTPRFMPSSYPTCSSRGRSLSTSRL
jgi:hypothetical protein